MSVLKKLEEKFAGAALPGSVKLLLDDGTVAFFDRSGERVENDSAADCELSLSSAVLEDLIAGRTEPMAAYFAGELKITGDLSVASELANLLKSGS